MTIKKLCYLVAMTTILFVQEELLTVVPSVQLTFFLIILYGATVGIGYGSIVVVAHVLMDNLFMGSFVVWTIVPMIVAYEITLIFGYLLRKKNEFIIAGAGVIAGLIYAALFIPIGVFVYEQKFVPYIIADIPFTLVLVTCNFITIAFLYKPMYKLLNRLLQGDKYVDPLEIKDEEETD